MPESREPSVAVVGATGAVGRQLVELIAERSFQFSNLKLFATEAGSAQTIDAGGEDRLVDALEDPKALNDFDIVFLATPAGPAADYIAARLEREHPEPANSGPMLIDLSAANRTDVDAPMVAPGLTSRAALEKLRTHRVFATPHPAAHVLATCLKALAIQKGVVTATVMLGASAGGRDVLTRTVDQTTDLLSARLELEEDDVQRGFNIFMREHERALSTTIAKQAAALLETPPPIAVQVVSVPVLHGSAITIDIAADDLSGARERLRVSPGVLIAEEGEPLSVIDAVGQEAIVVSVEERAASLGLWCVFDNTRLAALNALWIAETLALNSPALA